MDQSSQGGLRFQRSLALWTATALLVLLAAVLRLRELAWGKPFVYHPDEHNVVHAALNMVRERSLNPDFFHYPSILLYAEALLSAVLQFWIHADLRTDPAAHGLGPWDVAPEHFPFVLAGRAFVAASGVFSVVLLLHLWWRWFGWTAGLLAGVLLAVSPLHVEHSHYLTTDVPAMLWVLLALFSSARAADNMPALLLASVWSGLAASTKYPAGVVWFAVLAAAAANKQPLRAALISFICFIAAFAVTSPFAFLQPQRVWADLAVVRYNYSSGPWSAWNFWFYFSYLWNVGLGPIGCALAFIGWVWIVFARDVGSRTWRVVVGLTPWAYVAYLSTWSVRYERNLMPLLPFLLLFVGLALTKVLPRTPLKGRRVLMGALVLIIAWPPLAISQEWLRRLGLPDTRTLGLQWIDANVPHDAHIAREEYTPQVGSRLHRVTYVQVLGTRPYAWYLSEGVDYLVASSLIYERFRDTPGLGDFYRFVFERLPLVAEFRPDANTTGPTIRILRVPRWPPEDDS